MIIAKYIAVVLFGYLIGSIPFGVLVGRRAARVDIRLVGSGKIGTTNVLRAAGKKAAALVLLLDMTKGALPVIFAGLMFGSEYMVAGNRSLWPSLSAQALGAFAAMAGHSWSVFLKFKGGRGVATFFGGLTAMCPLAALFGGEVLILGAGLTRYVSLGSIAGVVGS